MIFEYSYYCKIVQFSVQCIPFNTVNPYIHYETSLLNISSVTVSTCISSEFYVGVLFPIFSLYMLVVGFPSHYVFWLVLLPLWNRW